ncbi:hypothetical protein GCM10022388_22630 [Flavobacterium chungnamense]|uniref:Uncharacterized protein n=1 Tax=Flavobacterium chungnamense TaxID=706182 RepID=A0ABP7UYC5_9FLAO
MKKWSCAVNVKSNYISINYNLPKSQKIIKKIIIVLIQPPPNFLAEYPAINVLKNPFIGLF